MSIEKIKEIENELIKNITVKTNRTLATSGLEHAIFQILGIMLVQEKQKEKEGENINKRLGELFIARKKHLRQKLEQEEQKENEIRETVMREHNKAFIKDCNGDSVVEVGQIWRSGACGEYLHEVVYINKIKDIVKLNDAINGILTKHLIMYYELVTMDNIKEGEWVECVTATEYYELGGKYKVANTLTQLFVKVGSFMMGGDRKHFQPTLPPTEKEETLADLTSDSCEAPKLYTQEDVDNIKDKARKEGKQEGWNDAVRKMHEGFNIIDRM